MEAGMKDLEGSRLAVSPFRRTETFFIRAIGRRIAFQDIRSERVGGPRQQRRFLRYPLVPRPYFFFIDHAGRTPARGDSPDCPDRKVLTTAIHD